MITLFENEDFILKSTGHDYDFVGIIETKCDEPLTFYFSEELIPQEESEEDGLEDYDFESCIDESKTELLEVYKGLEEYSCDTEDDEEQDIAESIDAQSYFRTRDDKSTGFLSDQRERGQFLAIIKHYCPEKLDRIAWA